MSTRRRTIRLATRESDLALRQAGEVKAALEDRRYEVELVGVETEGDRVRDELIQDLGKTGAFVRSLDERVIAGEVDAAVHSMKDVPTEGLDDLAVAAVPRRGPPADVLVTPEGGSLADLPPGAVVGTASLRRRAQVLADRPDLRVEPLRGNVDTRIEKLLAPALQAEHERRSEAESERLENAESGDEEREYERSVEEWFDDLPEIERRALEREVETEYDAIVLAEAGLERSGLLDAVATSRRPPGEAVPAPGQGALAVTCADDDLAEELHAVLDHPRSRVETTAERILLEALGGGCIAPLGVYALLKGEVVRVEAAAYSRDGDERVALSRDLPVESYADAAREFAADMADRGADELIAAAKRDADEREAPRRDGP